MMLIQDPASREGLTGTRKPSRMCPQAIHASEYACGYYDLRANDELLFDEPLGTIIASLPNKAVASRP